MADRLIQTGTLSDIADAIRAKTGKSAIMTPLEMPEEIASIETGGGGSLPSIISKIDGGSFTLSSDTQGTAYSISHNLGVVPKGFVFWTEDALSGTEATRFIANAYMTVADITKSNNTHYDAVGSVYILYNGNTTSINASLSSSAVDDYMTTSVIKWNNSAVYYKSGLTYKWIAWA